jgi:hypothetical protein
MTMLAAIEEIEGKQEIIFPMDEREARKLTNEIREHLGHLDSAREKILLISKHRGWKALGYKNFSEYGEKEFGRSFQQIYNIRAAAEYDEELSLHSPSGEIYQIPVNHAKELRKLKTPERRVRAYQKAEVMAKAQGKVEPTAKIVEDAVHTVMIEEQVEESPYAVVRQMFAEGSLSAPIAQEITAHLNRIGNELAQTYVQNLMANHRLSSPELILAIGLRYKSERSNGKLSKVLDEIDRTKGYLAGTYLSKANMTDWKRACEQAQDEYKSEADAAKRQAALLAGEVLPEEITLTLWKHAPAKSAQALKKMLPPNDLEAVFHLLAGYLGYVPSEAYAQVLENGLVCIEYMLHQAGQFETVEEGQDLQVLARVKPIVKEEKEEGETDG